MRLLEKNDASLAMALVAGVLVIFQRPLRLVIDAARDVELRYNIDLIPGLVVLTAAFAFHQYRKRQQARAAAASARIDVAQARQRSGELERLVAFGNALGSSLDAATLRQVFWRFIPAFSRDRDVWLAIRREDEWETLGRGVSSGGTSAEARAERAADVLRAPLSHDVLADGLLVGDEICFPMVAGDTTLGVTGVRNDPALSAAERRAMGAAVGVLAIAIRNVQLLTQTRENSVRDQLTGCFNRAYAVETLGTELLRAKRTGRPLSIIMFDVDRLKKVNDTHGHLAGDALLAAVSKQVASTLRASDVKCRWGGDEFLVVLPDTPLTGAEQAGASLTREVGALRVQTASGVVSPTISVGVAVADVGETDALALVGRADEALYNAKHAGRNRLSIAAPAPMRAAG